MNALSSLPLDLWKVVLRRQKAELVRHRGRGGPALAGAVRGGCMGQDQKQAEEELVRRGSRRGGASTLRRRAAASVSPGLLLVAEKFLNSAGFDFIHIAGNSTAKNSAPKFC